MAPQPFTSFIWGVLLCGLASCLCGDISRHLPKWPYSSWHSALVLLLLAFLVCKRQDVTILFWTFSCSHNRVIHTGVEDLPPFDSHYVVYCMTTPYFSHLFPNWRTFRLFPSSVIRSLVADSHLCMLIWMGASNTAGQMPVFEFSLRVARSKGGNRGVLLVTVILSSLEAPQPVREEVPYHMTTVCTFRLFVLDGTLDGWKAVFYLCVLLSSSTCV